MRELGEFALIERMNRGRVQSPSVLLGPGDDAAVLAAPDGRYVVSTDMLVQDRHFRLDWSSPREIGRKAIAQNAADVVAMGAEPSAFVVGLGCRGDTPVRVIDELVEGMWQEAQRAGGCIVGGDLVGGRELVVSVTAFGDLRGRAPIRRDGARVGDTVAVCGRLGWSAAGLAVLTAGRAMSDADLFAEVLTAHRVPQPNYTTVLGTAHTRSSDDPDGARLTSLTDVSDGLLADLGHIARASAVGIDVRSAAVADPVLATIAGHLDADVTQWILTGGEDHAFVGTWAEGGSIAPGWTSIGRVVPGHGVLVDGVARSGQRGWESFLAPDSSSGTDAR